MSQSIQEARFVPVVCTPTYNRRYEGKEAPGTGLGAKWEGYVITQEIYDAEGKNGKFIPVVFSPEDAVNIPTELRGATRYDLSLPDGYERFLRRLTDQPARRPSDVAPNIRALPAMERKRDATAQPWNVPLAFNPLFTGRGELLDEIHRTLQSSGAAALSGLGGIGKTETIARYAHVHRPEYSAVLWTRADSRDALMASFVSIAALLDLPGRGLEDQNLVVSGVRRWLEANAGWLLILDNANDLSLAREFLPQERKGHILFSTVQHATAAVAPRVDVRTMEPAEGALFLLRRTAIIAGTGQIDEAPEPAAQLARKLSTELGGLPLALDQAGAYIEETACGLGDYLKLYLTRAAELLKQRGSVTTGHEEPVAKTFALSFEKIALANPAAAEMLRLFAFLHPDDIPEDVITNGSVALGPTLGPAAADLISFNRSIAEVLKYSLIGRDQELRALSIHRVVQTVLRAEMDRSTERDWIERSVNVVNASFPEPNFENWAACERLLPHASACLAHIEQYSLESQAAGTLLDHAGYYLRVRAQFSEAENFHKGALEIREKTLGADHADVAVALNHLGWLYHSEGRYSAAEPLLRRALAIREKMMPRNGADFATSLNDLSVLLSSQGRNSEAKPLWERALAIREEVLGPEHPEVALSLNNLGTLYRHEERFTEAEPLLRRALEIRKKVLSPDHPEVAFSLNALASLKAAQKDYTEAEPLYRKALVIRERAFGPQHPEVALTLNDLATLYRDQGRYDEAKCLYDRALSIRETVLGPEHPDVADTLSTLATLYERQQNYATAEPLLRKALAIRERVLGPEHSGVAASLNNLALLCGKQGKYAEAERLFARAIAIEEKVLGPEHPELAKTLENYGRFLRSAGRDAAARNALSRARLIRRKSSG